MADKRPITNAKIAFVETAGAWEKAYLKKALGPAAAGAGFFAETAQEALPCLQAAEILSVFIKSRVDKALLDRAPKLKFVTTRSTGYDHIDLAECRRRGIAVSNVPTYGENTVAEHTFALILSLTRNLRKAYFKTMRGDFSLDGLMGFDLKGKTLGVVGTGHIGLHVIRMGLGFGMKVAAFDVKENKFLAEVMGFDYRPFEEVLGCSDILTLHVPYLPSTKHLINRKTVQCIKKGAYLVNTSRGGLVETDALVEALDKKILAGAGLDVLEEEEFLLEEKRFLGGPASEEHWSRLQTALKNNVLLHRENVIYTPHMAFYSKEAVERILDTTAENIAGFLDSKPVRLVS